MNKSLLALAIAVDLAAPPAFAQTAAATPEPPIVRDAESCTAGMAEDPGSGVALTYRIRVDGSGSLRASRRGWTFAPGTVHPIRFVAATDPASLLPPPRPAEGLAEGFRDEVGRSGVALPANRTAVAMMTQHTTIAIYGADDAEPLATVTNQALGAMAALNRCFEALVVADTGSGEPVVTYPALVGSAHALITDNDYPSAALRAGEAGTTRYRITISAHGLVGGCEIVRSSGSALLDQTACRLMTRRARFLPARDAGGRATVATMLGSINWRIPADDPPEPSSTAAPQ